MAQENKLRAPEISTNSVLAVLIHSRAEVSIKGMSYASPVKTCVSLSLFLFLPSFSSISLFPFPPFRFHLATFALSLAVTFPLLSFCARSDPRTLILKKSASRAFCEIQERSRSQTARLRKDNALPR